MSGRQAKAARRRERDALVESIAQAHDCLHRDDVDGCHNQLHAALGAGEVLTPVEPLRHLEAFDVAFRRLCHSHGRQASYVVIDTVDDGSARLISGGDAALTRMMDQAWRATVVQP